MNFRQTLSTPIRKIVRDELRSAGPRVEIGEIHQHPAPQQPTFSGIGRDSGRSFAEALSTTLPTVQRDVPLERLDADARNLLSLALREALQLGHNKIRPEHLLLAIVKDGQGAAAAALIRLAGTGKAARQAVIKAIVEAGQ